MEIPKEVLQIVFDTAIQSMEFGSGFLDDEEVGGLRACAVILGVDPDVATPENFKCKYSGRHEPYGAQYQFPQNRCKRCHMVLEQVESPTAALR